MASEHFTKSKVMAIGAENGESFDFRKTLDSMALQTDKLYIRRHAFCFIFYELPNPTAFGKENAGWR